MKKKKTRRNRTQSEHLFLFVDVLSYLFENLFLNFLHPTYLFPWLFSQSFCLHRFKSKALIGRSEALCMFTELASFVGLMSWSASPPK